MSRPRVTDVTILVATDNSIDGNMVKKLLDDEFDKVYISSDASHGTVDFDHCRPDVMILAFDVLENAERYYLGLYRQKGAIHLNRHRAIVLCNKDQVERAYTLCRDGIFDDYMLFWPMTNDSYRLPMTVLLALREIKASGAGSPTLAEFAAQAMRASSSGKEINQQLDQGGRYIASVDTAVSLAGSEAHAAFDQFSQRLVRNEVPGITVIQNSEILQGEFARVKHELIDQPRDRLAKSVEPLKQWAGKIQETVAPHLQALQSLDALSEKVPPSLLVVDDDALQHKILGFMLKEVRYQSVFASSVVEAMEILYKFELPDLILMDVMLPGIDGLQAVKMIKTSERTAKIPIIMMTGKSEKNILEASLDAGACDFIVKPFAGNTLLKKLNHVLSKHAASQ